MKFFAPAAGYHKPKSLNLTWLRFHLRNIFSFKVLLVTKPQHYVKVELYRWGFEVFLFGTSGRHCVSTAKPILTQGLEWVFAVVGVVAFYVFCGMTFFCFFVFCGRTFLWFCFLWHISFLVLFSVAGFFFLFLIYLSGLWPFSFVFSRTANNSILYFRGLGPDLVLGPDPVSVCSPVNP